MTEPRWLSITIVLAIHADQIREHGGALGIRDRGLLESALSRPQNLFNDQPGSDLAALAAAYGFGILRNHPFLDGNKRVAFQSTYTFLGLNGLTITAEEPAAVDVMLASASGTIQEPDLVAWLRGNTQMR